MATIIAVAIAVVFIDREPVPEVVVERPAKSNTPTGTSSDDSRLVESTQPRGLGGATEERLAAEQLETADLARITLASSIAEVFPDYEFSTDQIDRLREALDRDGTPLFVLRSWTVTASAYEPPSGVRLIAKPPKRSALYNALAEAVIDPSAAAKPAATSSRVLPGDGAPQLGQRVLVVDDNLVNRKIASRMLQRLGCEFATASGGLEAIELYQREPFDAVLMDCQMPELDGYETTVRIRTLEEGGAHVPILALTASALSEDRQKCLDAGMDGFLTKPISLEKLAEALLEVAGSASSKQDEAGVLAPKG